MPTALSQGASQRNVFLGHVYESNHLRIATVLHWLKATIILEATSEMTKLYPT